MKGISGRGPLVRYLSIVWTISEIASSIYDAGKQKDYVRAGLLKFKYLSVDAMSSTQDS